MNAEIERLPWVVIMSCYFCLAFLSFVYCVLVAILVQSVRVFSNISTRNAPISALLQTLPRDPLRTAPGPTAAAALTVRAPPTTPPGAANSCIWTYIYIYI